MIKLKSIFNREQGKAAAADAEAAGSVPADDGDLFGGVGMDEPPGEDGASTGEASVADATIETTATGPDETLAAVLNALRQELSLESAESVDTHDRKLRLSIEEVLYDLESGMTPYSAAKATELLGAQLPAWFVRRRTAEEDRNKEMAHLIVVMGKALKAIEGDDNQFHDSIDKNLDRLRQAADTVQVRSASARLLRIVDEATEQVAEQKATAEKRIRSLSEMVRGLHEELDQVKVEAQEDALTGLFNRKSFDDRMEGELRKSRLAPYQFSLVMIDLDHFKNVNDTYGHVVGDRVLQGCGKALQEVVLRRSDFCARYGGEEMAVVLADCPGPGALRVTENLRQAIEGVRVKAGAKEIEVTASFGIAEGCDTDLAEDVIERADSALYIAKRTGRNKVVLAGADEGRSVALPDSLLK
jgi:diguanylate cyclase (GGDEF)-like protein